MCARVCVFAAEIPEEQLRTCGVADCGLDVQGNSTTTRPAQELVQTLLGCYIGNVTAVLPRQCWTNGTHTVIKTGEIERADQEGIRPVNRFHRCRVQVTPDPGRCPGVSSSWTTRATSANGLLPRRPGADIFIQVWRRSTWRSSGVPSDA